eukprot:s102_g9.t1
MCPCSPAYGSDASSDSGPWPLRIMPVSPCWCKVMPHDSREDGASSQDGGFSVQTRITPGKSNICGDLCGFAPPSTAALFGGGVDGQEPGVSCADAGEQCVRFRQVGLCFGAVPGCRLRPGIDVGLGERFQRSGLDQQCLGVGDNQVRQFGASGCHRAPPSAREAHSQTMVLHWPVFEIISEQTLARITESEPQNLANIAWRFATIKWCNEPLVSAMAEQCVRSVKQFGPQECANFAWALANIMLVDMPCLAALGNKFMTGLRSGSTQNLTNTVWGCHHRVSVAAGWKYRDSCPSGKVADFCWVGE